MEPGSERSRILRVCCDLGDPVPSFLSQSQELHRGTSPRSLLLGGGGALPRGSRARARVGWWPGFAPRHRSADRSAQLLGVASGRCGSVKEAARREPALQLGRGRTQSLQRPPLLSGGRSCAPPLPTRLLLWGWLGEQEKRGMSARAGSFNFLGDAQTSCPGLWTSPPSPSDLGALDNDPRVRDQGGGAPWKGSGVEKGVDGKRGQGAGTLLPKWETLEARREPLGAVRKTSVRPPSPLRTLGCKLERTQPVSGGSGGSTGSCLCTCTPNRIYVSPQKRS